MIITLLLKLSNGWRPKRRNIDLPCEQSSMILKKFEVGYLYIVCSNDLMKDCCLLTQVLRVWDILPLEDIPKLVEQLDCIFAMYTDEYIRRCKKKCLEGYGIFFFLLVSNFSKIEHTEFFLSPI